MEECQKKDKQTSAAIIETMVKLRGIKEGKGKTVRKASCRMQ